MAEYVDVFPVRRAILAAPVTVDSETMVPVVALTTADVPAGIYTFTLSLVMQYDHKNDGLYWQLTGGTSSPEFYKGGSKDGGDVDGWSYTFPVDHIGGPISATLSARVVDETAPVHIIGASLVAVRLG